MWRWLQRGEAVSAPDPAAALRTFVAAKEKAGKYKEPSVYVTRDYTKSADALLEHVERLEAALREHAEAITAHRNAVAIDESAMLDCRRSVDTYGNRLATRARVKETQATLLALGREIQGRKP